MILPNVDQPDPNISSPISTISIPNIYLAGPKSFIAKDLLNAFFKLGIFMGSCVGKDKVVNAEARATFCDEEPA